MAKIRITQIKSKNGASQRQKDNLRCLGLRKLHQSVEVELNPCTKGMVQKVLHLVTVEEI